MDKSEVKQKVIDLLSMRPRTRRFLSKELNITVPRMNLLLEEMILNGQIRKEHHSYALIIKKDRKFLNPVSLIRWVMVYITSIAVVVSMYFTGKNLDLVMPTPLAIMFSSIMVLFSVFSVQLGVYFWGKRKHILSLAAILLGFISMIFTISSTVIVQYNERQKVEVTASTTDLPAITTYNRLLKEESEVEDFISMKQSDRARNTNILDNPDSTPKQITTARWTIAAIDKEIKEKGIVLSDIRSSILELTTKTPSLLSSQKKVEQRDAYTWIASLFHISSDLLTFIYSVFPAVLADFVSPFSMAVVLFLGRKHED